MKVEVGQIACMTGEIAEHLQQMAAETAPEATFVL
jgi:hypothetical protein